MKYLEIRLFRISVPEISLAFDHTLYKARNAGQLPQPFWIGDADGSGACRPAGCAART